MPPIVRDYILVHELAHVRVPNHSRKFWNLVAEMDPHWREAERWLRRHGRELL
jgi:predicted metal-dependent hydrolase